MRTSLLFLSLFLLARSSAAERKTISNVCSGCVATVPDTSDPAPLLVVLHGDGESAAHLHAAWERFAAPKDVAVLALTCPADLGCTGRFWAWNGDPKWISDKIEVLSKSHAIDRDRMYLAGWSGGASYIGLRTKELEGTFAAIVLHGGGIPPASDACADAKAPIFFLSGEQNPLRHLAVQLRDHYARCGNEVKFQSLPGADHAKEWAALDLHGAEIISTMLTKRRTPNQTAAISPRR